MEIPRDIAQRLERRWVARYGRETKIRQPQIVLNESEVTDKKVERPRKPASISPSNRWDVA